MTLADSLLESLEGWRPPEGRQTHSFAANDWTVSVTADRSDSVGCLLSDLTVARSTVDALPWPVRSWAERVAGRVTCLMEPLKVIEVDDERREAILRSQAPAKKGAIAQYYEIQLNGNGVSNVRRFKADTTAGTKREQVPFALTHEAVAKLAEDISKE